MARLLQISPGKERKIMIDPLSTSYEVHTLAQKPRKILRMVENERMAGSVPLWEKPAENDRHQIEAALSGTQTHAASRLSSQMPPSYRAASTENKGQEEFGFADLLDMVNPLQHIPVVSTLYRNLTGDTIHPIGQIVGGAVFGGPLGAAGGLVNAIVREETGNDLTGTAMALMLEGRMPKGKKAAENPEIQLGLAEKSVSLASGQLPGNMLALADLKAGYTSGSPTTRLANGEIITWKTASSRSS